MEEIDIIKNTILRVKHPSYQTTNKKEIRVRCPYCGDSKSDQSSAHLYIEMKPPFRFHCFKCETSGILNNQTLKDLEIWDQEANVSIITANNIYKANNKFQKVSFNKRSLINIPIESEITNNSLNYFNNRYHSKFNSEFVSQKFKVVLDPLYFFQNNHIFVPDGQYDFRNAIGFISSDSSHIIFRDTSGRQPKRYYNLNLYQDDEVGVVSKSYNISSELDALQPEVNLVITEGIFDIIGVYTHFYQNNENNTIFAAACGKAYNSVILNYIHKGFLNLNISIFSDGDVDQSFYQNLKWASPYLKNTTIKVYYNELYDKTTGFGKDYGCPANEIKLSKPFIF